MEKYDTMQHHRKLLFVKLVLLTFIFVYKCLRHNEREAAEEEKQWAKI